MFYPKSIQIKNKIIVNCLLIQLYQFYRMEAIINQLFEIEKKAVEQNVSIFERNFNRIQHELTEMGYKIVNPSPAQRAHRISLLVIPKLRAPAKKTLLTRQGMNLW